jgi:acetyl esterase/lipase
MGWRAPKEEGMSGGRRGAVLAVMAAVVALSALECARRGIAQGAPAKGDEAVFETVYLWEGPAPEAKGEQAEDRPRLYVFAAEAGKASGTAVIVCPGGGYSGRAMEHEGVQVAHWLNGLGVTAFLLSYRVSSAGYTPDDAFADAQRAVRLVRHRAKQYGVDPNRIGMIGFSAGGHLLSRLGLYHDAGDTQAADTIERQSSRPNFLLFCYTPTATGRWPEGSALPPAKVNASTPPTFIFHTTEDMVEPDGVIEWYRALRAAGVETELHIFGGYGPHGSGLSTGDPATSRWPELAAAWMRRNGFLTGKERASVEGMVTIDGEPMYIGYVTFTPVDSACDPIACGMVSGWVEMGKYRIPARHGPAPGKHRVEVRHTALAPSTEPVLMEEVRYTKLSPKGEAMVVEIHPGANTIDFDIRSRR